MKRKAVLIGAPGDKVKGNYLDGVSVYMSNMAQFLTSNIGGAWNDDEIQIIINPSKNDLLKAVKGYHDYDYAIFYFSGHGGVEIRNNKQYIDINDKGEEIAISEIINVAKRELVILDTCSSYFQKTIQVFNEMRLAKSRIDSRQTHRDLFFKAISQSELGYIIMNATAPGQVAGEDDNGGFFTQGLLTSVGIGTSVKVLGVNVAFNMAENFVTGKARFQTPKLTGQTRRKYWFPFTVAI